MEESRALTSPNQRGPELFHIKGATEMLFPTSWTLGKKVGSFPCYPLGKESQKKTNGE